MITLRIMIFQRQKGGGKMKISLNNAITIVLLSLICFLALISCNAKKSTTERTILSDTLKTISLTYKTKPIQTNYTFDLVCDTITGKIRNVNFKDSSGDNSASLIIENNQLKARLNVAETESKTDTIYKSVFKDVHKDREVVRYKTAFWHWILHLLLVILLALKLKRYFSI